MATFQSFIAFDTETTGIDADSNQIIEIAGVKFDLVVEDGKVWPRVTGQFEEFVKPTMHIPEEASAINHIYDKDVENARPIQEVLPDFFKFCGQSHILVAHNAPFDIRFLVTESKRHNLQMTKAPILDSLKISRKVMNEAPSHALGELARRLRREVKLNLNSENLHRALYDCEVLAQVFIAILRKRMLTPDFELGSFHKKIEDIHGGFSFLK